MTLLMPFAFNVTQPNFHPYRYSATGSGIEKFYGTAVGGVRRPHPVAQYEITIEYNKREYEHGDREGI